MCWDEPPSWSDGARGRRRSLVERDADEDDADFSDDHRAARPVQHAPQLNGEDSDDARALLQTSPEQYKQHDNEDDGAQADIHGNGPL